MSCFPNNIRSDSQPTRYHIMNVFGNAREQGDNVEVRKCRFGIFLCPIFFQSVNNAIYRDDINSWLF